MLKSKLYNYFLFFLFFAVSGGAFFYILKGRYFITLFLILSFITHIAKFKRIKVTRSMPFLFFMAVNLLFNYFIINPLHKGNTFLPNLMLLIASYLFFTCFQYREFKGYYLNTLVALAIISIGVFVGVQIGALNTQFYATESFIGGHTLCLFHKVGNLTVSNRLSGIFWEPGAYQIPLNMTFLLYMREIISGDMGKTLKIKLLIVLLTVLLTQSTAAFLMLGIGLVYFSFKKLFNGKFTITSIFFVLLSSVGAYFLYYSDAVQNKLAQDGDSEASSYSIRMMDNMAMLQMVSERPIFGYGIDSAERAQRNLELDNQTSSNGLLQMATCLGVPFVLFYLFFLYKGIKRIEGSSIALSIVFLFAFLNSFEVYWYFPLAFTFHFIYDDGPDYFSSEFT